MDFWLPASGAWSKHLLLLLLSQCKSEEEKEFYLLSATHARWSHRELERQIKKSAVERTMLSELKLATASRVLRENATGVFKDSYLVDFLDLPDTHSEADLQKGMLFNLRKFLMELGDSFAFVGEKVRVQVGQPGLQTRSTLLSSRSAVLGCVRTENGSLRTRAHG